MATKPNGQDDSDKIISLREARAKQAAAQAKSGQDKPEKKMPVLLIFLGLLAILVAYKFLVG
ncbi:unnamed protein product [Phaeothamnion confervicola]